MPDEVQNSDLALHVFRSLIDIIGRRSSEAYAIVGVSTIKNKILEKYYFLKYIDIKETSYVDTLQLISIQPEINDIQTQQLCNAINEIIDILTASIGKAADFYFLRELKEDIGDPYDQILIDHGVNLDSKQFKYLLDRKKIKTEFITNSDLLKNVLEVTFEVIQDMKNRREAYTTIVKSLNLFSTKYEFLQYVHINDISIIKDVDLITLSEEVNNIQTSKISEVVNKILIEANKTVNTEAGPQFVTKFKNRITKTYLTKLEKIGVDLKILLQTGHESVFRHVFEALIEILTQASTQSYAVLAIDEVLKKINTRFEFLKFITVDSNRYSDGVEAITILFDIEKVSPVDAGRAIQKLIEEIITYLGEEAGQHFIDEFKKNLGETYLIRIEEMGVNLHMVELRRNLAW